MAHAAVADRLRRVADVVDAGARSAKVPGRLDVPVLHALAALVPCDSVTFCDVAPESKTCHADDEVTADGFTFLPEPLTEPDDPFWQHYPGAALCSYPTRTGDHRSVVLRTDFQSTREWKQTPMYRDVMRAYGCTFELMCPLPPVGARSPRLLFLRSGPVDFSEDDRFALSLLRPHLVEMLGSRRAGGRLGLTQRQDELLQLVATGRTNAEIAASLHLSPHTVRTHLTNVFERLGVTTRAAAVARLLSS